MNSKAPRSAVLSPEDEAATIAVRRHSLLPPDRCLYALQPSLPQPTRSSLHRCLQRHGMAQLPKTDGAKPKRSRFKASPIGFFHIDIAEMHAEEGRLYLFVAVDRSSNFAITQLHHRATCRIAAHFLRSLVAAMPDRIDAVLTDSGTQSVDRKSITEGAEAKADACWTTREEPRIWRAHAFNHACEQNRIKHRTTTPAHPCTNGQVQRMNRTLKDASVRRYLHRSHDELRQHLQLFFRACNRARRLKTGRGLTPYEFICKAWTEQPPRLTSDPEHYTLRPQL